jgi:acyl-coenzyme A thioesterase PaaI-like protein
VADDTLMTADGWFRPHQPNCLGCGDENPLGLRLRMRPRGDGVTGQVTFRSEHEGAPGFAHGGAVATALDDAFGMMLVKLGAPAVTARLEVDYRRPVFIGRPYTVRAECERKEGRKLWLEACLLEGGIVVAAARSLFVKVDPQHFLQGREHAHDGAQRLPW